MSGKKKPKRKPVKVALKVKGTPGQVKSAVRQMTGSPSDYEYTA